MRGERQLLRLGEYLVSRARQGLPQDIREERYREWVAELPAILHDPQVRSAPRRAAHMLAYAADTLRGAATTPGKTPGPIARRAPALTLLFLVTGLVAVVLSVWAIVQAPGNGQNYLQLTWSLLFVTYFTSRLLHAAARMTTPLMFSTALVLEGLTVWQAAQAPGDWVNYMWAALLGLVLLAALLVRWFPRLQSHARKA
jgi:hypothetical protein